VVVASTSRVLASAVRHVAEPIPGISLYPVNPGAPEQEHRFPQRALLEFAREKGLAHAAILSAVFTDALAAAASPEQPQAVIPGGASAPPAGVAGGKSEWHRDATAFVGKVERALRARATTAGQSFEKALADLLRQSDMKALHGQFEDWQTRLGAGRARVKLQTFRLFLHERFPAYRFPGGARPGNSAREFLRQLLADYGADNS